MAEKAMVQITENEMLEHFRLVSKAHDYLAKKLGYKSTEEMAKDGLQPQLHAISRIVIARPL